MPAEVQDEAEEAPHEGAEDGEEQVWEFTLAHAFKTLVSSVKGSSYAVGKAPENLTSHQRAVLEQIRNANKRYYNAYDIKEMLRMILKMRNKVEAELYLKK